MIKQYVVVLDGTPQNLLTAAAGASVPSVAGATVDLACRAIWLSPRGTNNNPIYLGDSALLSNTNYGIRLEAGDINNLPPAPFTAGEFNAGPLKLSDFWVLGTATEILHVLMVPF